MPDETRIAVIGAADFAARYHIPRLVVNPDVELLALSSRTIERLQEKAQRFAVPNVYTDYRALLDNTPLDAVVISSAHTQHYQQIKDSLERGLHVHVDKHVVMHASEWQELMALAKARGLILMPALNRHLDPANLYAKHLIQSGALGEVFYARSLQVNYPRERSFAILSLAGGGPLVGRGSHMAALIPWLTGWQPAAVAAFVTYGGKLDVDTGGTVDVHTTNGNFFQIASMKNGFRNVDEVEVVGTEGAVKVERPRQHTPWQVTHFGKGGEVVPIGELPAGKATTDHFVDVIRGREPSRIPPADALPAVQIVEAAYESAGSGRVIKL
ncbi:MAG: Gfo/Idh/MocA family oxidoreductase [Dehalococcoidales bacterium]|nr:Gfo/Idh/MocA family oxidoreductase [Dehalococcoidales bacterium]